jgi:hypothetical protein
MARKLHPVAAELIRGFAKVGAKALGAAADSFLEDIEHAGEHVTSTVKRSRARLRSRRTSRNEEE